MVRGRPVLGRGPEGRCRDGSGLPGLPRRHRNGPGLPRRRGDGWSLTCVSPSRGRLSWARPQPQLMSLADATLPLGLRLRCARKTRPVRPGTPDARPPRRACRSDEKPLVYQRFGTKAGVLVELYGEFKARTHVAWTPPSRTRRRACPRWHGSSPARTSTASTRRARSCRRWGGPVGLDGARGAPPGGRRRLQRPLPHRSRALRGGRRRLLRVAVRDPGRGGGPHARDRAGEDLLRSGPARPRGDGPQRRLRQRPTALTSRSGVARAACCPAPSPRGACARRWWLGELRQRSDVPPSGPQPRRWTRHGVRSSFSGTVERWGREVASPSPSGTPAGAAVIAARRRHHGGRAQTGSRGILGACDEDQQRDAGGEQSTAMTSSTIGAEREPWCSMIHPTRLGATAIPSMEPAMT